MRTQLTNKYGEPITDDEDWDTEQHKNWYSEEKDKGLSYGYLTFSTLFANDRTLIYMVMDAENYSIRFNIYYYSRQIEEPEADYSNEF